MNTNSNNTYISSISTVWFILWSVDLYLIPFYRCGLFKIKRGGYLKKKLKSTFDSSQIFKDARKISWSSVWIQKGFLRLFTSFLEFWLYSSMVWVYVMYWCSADEVNVRLNWVVKLSQTHINTRTHHERDRMVTPSSASSES